MDDLSGLLKLVLLDLVELDGGSPVLLLVLEGSGDFSEISLSGLKDILSDLNVALDSDELLLRVSDDLVVEGEGLLSLFHVLLELGLSVILEVLLLVLLSDEGGSDLVQESSDVSEGLLVGEVLGLTELEESVENGEVGLSLEVSELASETLNLLVVGLLGGDLDEFGVSETVNEINDFVNGVDEGVEVVDSAEELLVVSSSLSGESLKSLLSLISGVRVGLDGGVESRSGGVEEGLKGGGGVSDVSLSLELGVLELSDDLSVKGGSITESLVVGLTVGSEGLEEFVESVEEGVVVGVLNTNLEEEGKHGSVSSAL